MNYSTLILVLYLLNWICIFICEATTRVLVCGGSGRVGGSAVRALCQRFNDKSLLIHVGGRQSSSFDEFTERNKIDRNRVKFVQLDVSKINEIDKIINNYDIIVNTAGPFQGLEEPILLEKTLHHGLKYIDVCDDVALSRICRSLKYQTMAKTTGGSAVISAGIWPGCSSLFAQHLILKYAGKHDEVDKVEFLFHTSGTVFNLLQQHEFQFIHRNCYNFKGSGGAGATILTATFLIIGENALTYVDGKPVYYPATFKSKTVDFGGDIGIRDVALLNLIECESCHCSGINNVETYFGTAPALWNALFVAMAKIIPQNVLQNRVVMDQFARFSLPMVRLVDSLVGSKNGNVNSCYLKRL
jgi:hypothetical protein